MPMTPKKTQAATAKYKSDTLTMTTCTC